MCVLSCAKKEEPVNLETQHDLEGLYYFDQATSKFRGEILALHPQWMSRAGDESKNSELNDRSNAIAMRMVNSFVAYDALAKRTINPNVLAYQAMDKLRLYAAHGDVIKFLSSHWYALPFADDHVAMFHFLEREHTIVDKRSLEAYKNRIIDTKRKIKSLQKAVGLRAERGVLPNDTILRGIAKSIEQILATEAAASPLVKRIKPVEGVSEAELEKYREDITWHIENTMYKYLRRYRDAVNGVLANPPSRNAAAIAAYNKERELLELNIVGEIPNYFTPDTAAAVSVKNILLSYLE